MLYAMRSAPEKVYIITKLFGENLVLLQWHELPLLLLLGCQMKFGSEKYFYILL